MITKINIYTVKDLLSSIINEIIDKWIKDWEYKKIRDDLIVKFIAELEVFIENWCFPDNFKVKWLDWNVYEIRISIPKKYLLRIIFYMEPDKIILTTWYLIKENKWDYKKQQKLEIEKLYEDEIYNSKMRYKDFIKDNSDYICLNEFFNI